LESAEDAIVQFVEELIVSAEELRDRLMAASDNQYDAEALDIHRERLVFDGADLPEGA
jgi:hypothetical protein